MSLSNNLEIPGKVTLQSGNGGLRKVIVESSSSVAEVYLQGAHITHFQKLGEAPLLFLSAASHFKPGKSIQGGIPIIFPWFGERDDQALHGIAHSIEWDLTDSRLLADGSVELDFQLPRYEDFEVSYTVKIADCLSVKLVIHNCGPEIVTFENCLHTYIQVADISKISISGLAGTAYWDKVLGVNTREIADAMDIDRKVDRVYRDASQAVNIHDPAGMRTVTINKSGSQSTVVWNPWIEDAKKLDDLLDNEYLQMVCVESGNVLHNPLTLASGATTVLEVQLSSQTFA